MASSNNRARVGRWLVALGGLWILLGFADVFFLNVRGFDFNPVLGFVLFFVGRSLVRTNRRRPIEEATANDRPLRTDQPQPPPPPERRTPPAPPARSAPMEPSRDVEGPSTEERDEILENILLSATELSESEAEESVGDQQGDFSPISSAEMIAKAREKFNKR